MHEFSAADGFVEIAERLAEMIKYAANEPSVGLFYIQQHTQNAVPNLINLKNSVTEKSRLLTLHTEDLEDSITSVGSMKECGFPIADEMIKEITKSLSIMSTKQAKSGLIQNPSSGFRMGRTSSWGPSTWGRNVGSQRQDGERSSNYISSVLKSAKERATNFKWTQLDSREMRQIKRERVVPRSSTPPPAPDTEVDELPLSSRIADELQQEEDFSVDESFSKHEPVLLPENFEEFRADREAKLEEWLGSSDSEDGRVVGGAGAIV